MDLKEMGTNMRNWVDLGQDMDFWRALVNEALNLWCHKPWSYLYKFRTLLVINMLQV